MRYQSFFTGKLLERLAQLIQQLCDGESNKVYLFEGKILRGIKMRWK
jgi:hypothetical protein